MILSKASKTFGVIRQKALASDWLYTQGVNILKSSLTFITKTCWPQNVGILTTGTGQIGIAGSAFENAIFTFNANASDRSS
jgi:hypothetical protein